ncbi:MAG: hypothetical protein ACLT1J_14385 [Mediterraneibacter gnavus]
MLIPEGVYRVTSLFLKDHLTMELAKGAVLSAYTEREKFSILRGTYQSEDQDKRIYSRNLGRRSPGYVLPESSNGIGSERM